MNWIDATEKLPTESGHYLVSTSHFPKNYPAVIAEFYSDDKLFYDEAYENHIDNVTYWVKLDLPPCTNKSNYNKYWDSYKPENTEVTQIIMHGKKYKLSEME